MQLRNAHLDRMVAMDEMKEILEALTPASLSIVALCMDGLSIREAEKLLGLKPRTGGMRMTLARRKVREKVPDLYVGQRRPTVRGDGGG